MKEIVDNIKRHLKTFIEKKHPAFNNLPICPFAKQVRINNKIDYVVIELKIEYLEYQFSKFAVSNEFKVAIFISPIPIFYYEFVNLLAILKEPAEKRGLVVFDGHPDHPIFYRRDPYPIIQVLKKETFEDARAVLEKTKYFDNLPPEFDLFN